MSIIVGISIAIMKNLQNKQSFNKEKGKYRISLNIHSANKEWGQHKRRTSMLPKLDDNKEGKRQKTSLQHNRTETPSLCQLSVSEPQTPSPKDRLLLKMISLSRHIGQKLERKHEPDHINEFAYRQTLEQQIERDCLKLLQKSYHCNHHRTILKRNYKQEQEYQQFKFERSNTF